MTHKRTLAAAAALGLTAASAIADDRPLGGDPITMETLLDHAEMIRIADAIDAGVDSKQWEATRAFFTQTIDVDFSSLVGGEPATIAADALISGWSANLTAAKPSFHMRSNHSITFHDADNATLFSHGYAWNRMAEGALEENGGDPMWEVWGNYEHGFTRTEDGWRVNAMSFFAVAERGNPFVRNTPGN